jgi:hypothetical protein
MTRLTLIRIGLVLFFGLAILYGIVAGHDVGHKPGEAPANTESGMMTRRGT